MTTFTVITLGIAAAITAINIWLATKYQSRDARLWEGIARQRQSTIDMQKSIIQSQKRSIAVMDETCEGWRDLAMRAMNAKPARKEQS